MLEPEQLKSKGSFCRRHSWSGWAKAGYRWFISDSVLSQGTCSLGGNHGQQSLSGSVQAAHSPSLLCPIPPQTEEDIFRRHQDKPWPAAPFPTCCERGEDSGREGI